MILMDIPILRRFEISMVNCIVINQGKQEKK